MEKVKVGTIWATQDYDAFKRLEGNRDDVTVRANRIKKSIKENGYVRNPITVNERGEVIDGQGRLEACRQLNIPIEFVVAEGVGLKECIALNSSTKNWSLKDYIKAYMERGNVSYAYLMNLIKAYGQEFNFQVIMNAITGKAEKTTRVSIKDGKFACTPEQYDEAIRVLEKHKLVKDVFQRIGGSTDAYYNVMRFCYFHPKVDNDRLVKKIHQLQGDLIPTTYTEQALRVIENIYNNMARNKVYIESDYKKAQNEKYVWYSALWGGADA